MKTATSFSAQHKLHVTSTEKLVLLCARNDYNKDIQEQISVLIAAGIDWRYFVAAVVEQKIVVIVYNTIRNVLFVCPVPSFVFDNLRNAYLYIVSKTLLQHKEVLRLLGLFSKEQIRVVPLKGTILSKRLYGDTYFRDISSDIDLFIKQEDKERVRNILAKEGYILTLRGNDDYSGYNEFKKAGSVSVDLQWKIIETIDCTRQRLEGFWLATQQIEEEGVCFSAFQTEELLLYLCAHSMRKHCFNQLRHLCDIHQLLTVNDTAIDWTRIIQRAKNWNLSASLSAALIMREYLFNVSPALTVKKNLKIPRFKIMLIKVFVKEKVIFQRGCFRRKLLDRLLCFIFFRFIESHGAKSYFTFFFPPREALQSKSYLIMLWRGFRRFISVFMR